MNLPKGNPLFERVKLSYNDIEMLIENLRQNRFNGYIYFDFGRAKAALFFEGGEPETPGEDGRNRYNAVEIGEDGLFRPIKRQRLFFKLSHRSADISVYVLSAQIVRVLSGIFVFSEVYGDSDARKKEFKKILNSLEADGISGMMEMLIRGDRHILLLDRGLVVTDNFADEYGQILCGIDRVERFIERAVNEGTRFSVSGVPYDAMSGKIQEADSIIEREKDLKVKTMGGFMKTNDAVKLDDSIIKSWGLKSSAAFQVEVENADGSIFTVKASGGKNLGSQLSVPAPLMKKMNVKDGDVVSLKPLLQ